MSTRKWLGGAAAVVQVTEYVFGGTWEATDVINLTVGVKVLSVVAGSTTITTVIDAIVTAWNALDSSVYPEFAEITASRSSSSLVLTGGTAGYPFACTVATTETGGGAADAQTIDGGASSTGTDSTACSGPNWWSVAANWSGGAVPIASDDVIIEKSDVDILYGLSHATVALATLRIDASYTGNIGLPERNTNGTEYGEYRLTYLTIESAIARVGQGEGTGSQRIKWDADSGTATTLLVYRTSSGADVDTPALLFKGTNAGNVVRVTGGSVGIAALGGEAATVATLGVQGGEVVCGTGATLTTIDMEGGTLTVASNSVTISKVGGTLTVLEGTITTLNNRAGLADLRGAGTITTLNNNGEAIFTGDNRALTVTNCTLYRGATFDDSGERVTVTNGIDLYECGIEDVVIRQGKHFTLSKSAI